MRVRNSLLGTIKKKKKETEAFTNQNINFLSIILTSFVFKEENVSEFRNGSVGDGMKSRTAVRK